MAGVKSVLVLVPQTNGQTNFLFLFSFLRLAFHVPFLDFRISFLTKGEKLFHTHHNGKELILRLAGCRFLLIFLGIDSHSISSMKIKDMSRGRNQNWFSFFDLLWN